MAPISLEDFDGGGVNLVSNGQTAFQAKSQTTSTTDFVQAMAAASGAGASPGLIAAGPAPASIWQYLPRAAGSFLERALSICKLTRSRPRLSSTLAAEASLQTHWLWGKQEAQY
jgi:hypothetical protein